MGGAGGRARHTYSPATPIPPSWSHCAAPTGLSTRNTPSPAEPQICKRGLRPRRARAARYGDVGDSCFSTSPEQRVAGSAGRRAAGERAGQGLRQRSRPVGERAGGLGRRLARWQARWGRRRCAARLGGAAAACAALAPAARHVGVRRGQRRRRRARAPGAPPRQRLAPRIDGPQVSPGPRAVAAATVSGHHALAPRRPPVTGSHPQPRLHCNRPLLTIPPSPTPLPRSLQQKRAAPPPPPPRRAPAAPAPQRPKPRRNEELRAPQVRAILPDGSNEVGASRVEFWMARCMEEGEFKRERQPRALWRGTPPLAPASRRHPSPRRRPLRTTRSCPQQRRSCGRASWGWTLWRCRGRATRWWRKS
jgi:hypothetical protein